MVGFPETITVGFISGEFLPSVLLSVHPDDSFLFPKKLLFLISG
jgi:hypothetical protein